MNKVVVAVVGAVVLVATGLPIAAALVVATVAQPAEGAVTQVIACTTSATGKGGPTGEAIGPGLTAGSPQATPTSVGILEGGVGFPLPLAGVPRRASLVNAPLAVPSSIKALYLSAAERYRIPWALLAGIGMEETSHGRTAAVSSAGAEGLMQFIPATWSRYGVDGNQDGQARITDPADSVMSAANYLTAMGATKGAGGVRAALFAYNHADWYVNDVLYYAHTYGGGWVWGNPSACLAGERSGPIAGPQLTQSRVTAVLAWARSKLGDPYVFGAVGPNAWDCSSYTRAAFAEIGIHLPRTAQAQRDWLAAGNGIRVRPGTELPGDLVFADTYLGPNVIGHVMLVANPAGGRSIEAHGAAVSYSTYTRFSRNHIYEIWRLANIAG